uniref:Uncharacterized protein n=1 Tax=Symphyocladiella dendroidea TaxID=2506487 RepID=A0A1Z1M782_9FLOR|nr:hypothetical protein [Symphyocladiella dendroidea]ARW61948.1 hypothetical protein [Symphyocladiella dendroidea]
MYIVNLYFFYKFIYFYLILTFCEKFYYELKYLYVITTKLQCLKLLLLQIKLLDILIY